MAKSLLGQAPCVYLVVNEKELQIAIDISHEPWCIIGRKLLRLLKKEMGSLEYELEDVDNLIALLQDISRKLQ